jgi:hypothetical protein
MRNFQIALEIIWCVLGLVCLYLGIARWSAPGRISLMFFLLAGLAFIMAFIRNSARRKREKREQRDN